MSIFRPSPSFILKVSLLFSIAILLGSLASCRPAEAEYDWIELNVTASAYNSVSWQTSGQPNLAAWGDTLKPGMLCIAVSRDLIGKGLVHNTMVKIEGLEGIYLVKDKMHRRWLNRIDIYMGKDVKKAREWGKQKLKIQYAVKRDSLGQE